MKKYVKNFLYSRGFSLTRITKDPNKPIELSDEENEIIYYVRSNNLSMCTTLNLQQTAVAAKYIAINNIPGDFVECGVFRGGNALIAAKIFKMYKMTKKVYLFDTFTGMTEPTRYDLRTRSKSPTLKKYLLRKRESYTDWAYASIEEVKENFQKCNLLTSNVVFVKGKVEDTLEQESNIPHAISFLRLDTDWYESTKIELEKLYEKLVPGGILVVDDYGCFDGARKAFDEYFEKHSPPPFLSLIDDGARIGIKFNG
jgi:O-methyltransferase